ncbi:MAG TPA: hypothetical protein VK694_02495 [Verrucomicrobiae bacterium]|nr:hypothetical protein [Verrucomicrobiae bacterium]
MTHTHLTKEHYEQQVADCDGLCIITDDMLAARPDLMRCVTCPFCKEVVNAILTPTTISCPKCEVTVNR